MLACVGASPLPGYVAVLSLSIIVAGLVGVVASFAPTAARAHPQIRKYAGISIGVGNFSFLVSMLFVTLRCGP